MKTRIVITVAGGLVQHIASNKDVEIAYIDLDNIKECDEHDEEFKYFEFFDDIYDDTFIVKYEPDSIDENEVNKLFKYL